MVGDSPKYIELNSEKIKNVKGTAKRTNNSNWIKKYREACNIKDSTQLKCVIFGCGEKSESLDLDGAHVHIVGKGKIEYDVPMCKHHNHPSNEDEMKVNKRTRAVPVNTTTKTKSVKNKKPSAQKTPQPKDESSQYSSWWLLAGGAAVGAVYYYYRTT